MSNTHLLFAQVEGRYGEFLGEFPEDDTPDELYDLNPLHLDRVGDDLFCREHPMMSPLPDLKIENGYNLPRQEVYGLALAWWSENYGI